jgi:hypothetical protein
VGVPEDEDGHRRLTASSVHCPSGRFVFKLGLQDGSSTFSFYPHTNNVIYQLRYKNKIIAKILRVLSRNNIGVGV